MESAQPCGFMNFCPGSDSCRLLRDHVPARPEKYVKMCINVPCFSSQRTQSRNACYDIYLRQLVISHLHKSAKSADRSKKSQALLSLHGFPALPYRTHPHAPHAHRSAAPGSHIYSYGLRITCKFTKNLAKFYNRTYSIF
jgi:hypothetical protein